VLPHATNQRRVLQWRAQLVILAVIAAENASRFCLPARTLALVRRGSRQ